MIRTSIFLILTCTVATYAQSSEPCADKLPNCQKNLGLCTADGELVFQHHYCRATCGNCFGNSLEAIVPPCPAEYPLVPETLKTAFTSTQINLAWQLYKSIPEHEKNRHGPNFMFSPFSVGSMLTVLYEGASGSTKQDMEQISLFQSLDPKEIRHVYAKMQNTIRRQMMQPLPKATELYHAILLYFGEQFKIRKSFRELATGCYDATLFRRKKADNPPQIKEEINKAIQGMSFGTIKYRVLDPNNINVGIDPRHLTLANGVHFKTDFNGYYPIVMHEFLPPSNQQGKRSKMTSFES